MVVNRKKPNKLKEFQRDLIKIFSIPMLDKYLVFVKNPRVLIWFLCSYITLISKYGLLAIERPLIYLLVMILILLIQILFISVVCSDLVECLLRYASSVRRVATSTEKERLQPIFKEVYTKVLRKNKGIGRSVKLYIVDSMEVNAFIIGKNTLVITRGAMETFNDDELKGIIAHEFGHINNYDGQIAILIEFCTSLFLWGFIAVSFVFKFLETMFEKNILGDIFGIIRQIFYFTVNITLLVWTLIISGGSRHTEYKADMYAKSIGYGEQLKNALYILYDMEISDKRGLLENLKRSHPILAYRIERLENSK